MRNIHIIAHTHWDREWYRPFQYFRTKLVFVIDKLIETLETDPDFSHFALDGQSVVLEDYLEIKPENADRIRSLVNDGRLSLGPWYIQPDEFAPNGESMVRNLLIGIGIAEKYGGTTRIGYLPDSFGQSGQMPQILRGFGIDSAVVMRGIDAAAIGRSEFLWEGINGDQLLAIYLPEGYSNAMYLPADYLKARMRLSCMIGKLRKWAGTKHILLMNGVDHQFPQAHLPELVKRLNARSRKLKYEISSLDRYIEAIRASDTDLPKLRGDLLVPARNRVHTSIASTRIYQKQKNREMETLLANYTEPLAGIGWLFGASYPTELINQAWKYLLQNQTHDGIGGCCTDAVHREMDQRFEDIRNIGETLQNAFGRAISCRIADEQLSLTVFNSSLTRGKQFVRARVYHKRKEFVLVDSSGTPVSYQVENVAEVDLAQKSIWTAYLNAEENSYQVDITFQVDFDFNVGFKIFQIQKGAPVEPERGELVQEKKTRLENEFLVVEIHPDGSLDLIDKSSGTAYPGLLVFEDCGDAGDSYNFSPVKNDSVIRSDGNAADIQLIENGPLKQTALIRQELIVPAELAAGDQARSGETVAMPIKTRVSLTQGQRYLSCSAEVDNTARDHRLRVIFPTGINPVYSHAETQFGTVKRPIKGDTEKWVKEKLHEKPLPIYPMGKFVLLKEGAGGLAVLNRGLSEYEIYQQDSAEIAVTLIRAVGMMGKEDLAIRPGRPSGMVVPTPDAQCPGLQRLEFAIAPFCDEESEQQIPAMAAAFNAAPLAVQSHLELKNIKKKYGLLLGMVEIENLASHIADQLEMPEVKDLRLITLTDDRLLISAVKKAETEQALIIRIYNSSSATVEEAAVLIGVDVGDGVSVTFEENELGSLDQREDGGYLIPDLSPYSAVTLKFPIR